MCPDTYLWLKILLTYDAGFVQERVAEYLLHDNNLSKTGTIEQKYSDTLIPKNIREYANKIGANEPYVFETLNRMEKMFSDRFYHALIGSILSGKLNFPMIKKADSFYLLDMFLRGIMKQ